MENTIGKTVFILFLPGQNWAKLNKINRKFKTSVNILHFNILLLTNIFIFDAAACL